MINIFLSIWTKASLVIATVILYNLYKYLYKKTPVVFQEIYENRPAYCGRNYRRTWMDIHFGGIATKGKKVVAFIALFLILKFGGQVAFILYVIICVLFSLFHIKIIAGNIVPVRELEKGQLSKEELKTINIFIWIYNISRIVMLLNVICILTNIIY